MGGIELQETLLQEAAKGGQLLGLIRVPAPQPRQGIALAISGMPWLPHLQQPQHRHLLLLEQGVMQRRFGPQTLTSGDQQQRRQTPGRNRFRPIHQLSAIREQQQPFTTWGQVLNGWTHVQPALWAQVELIPGLGQSRQDRTAMGAAAEQTLDSCQRCRLASTIKV